MTLAASLGLTRGAERVEIRDRCVLCCADRNDVHPNACDPARVKVAADATEAEARRRGCQDSFDAWCVIYHRTLQKTSPQPHAWAPAEVIADPRPRMS